jgi:putative acetyltransferase
MRGLVRIREFQPGDEASLHAVFLSAIREIASKDYTPAQIEIWTQRSLDPGVWARRIQSIRPFVVESEGTPVAYADVQTSGYIDHFFVSGSCARQGIGTLLMRHILATASARNISVLTSDVSRTAQPFFARFGFAIVEQRADTAVPNALMRYEMVQTMKP